MEASNQTSAAGSVSDFWLLKGCAELVSPRKSEEARSRASGGSSTRTPTPREPSPESDGSGQDILWIGDTDIGPRRRETPAAVEDLLTKRKGVRQLNRLLLDHDPARADTWPQPRELRKFMADVAEKISDLPTPPHSRRQDVRWRQRGNSCLEPSSSQNKSFAHKQIHKSPARQSTSASSSLALPLSRTSSRVLSTSSSLGSLSSSTTTSEHALAGSASRALRGRAVSDTGASGTKRNSSRPASKKAAKSPSKRFKAESSPKNASSPKSPKSAKKASRNQALADVFASFSVGKERMFWKDFESLCHHRLLFDSDLVTADCKDIFQRRLKGQERSITLKQFAGLLKAVAEHKHCYAEVLECQIFGAPKQPVGRTRRKSDVR